MRGRLVDTGSSDRTRRLVAILTGHILTDPQLLLGYHQELDPPPSHDNRPAEIESTLSAVEGVLRRDRVPDVQAGCR